MEASQRQALREQQLAFLRKRVVSETARQEWEQNLAQVLDELLATKVEALFPLAGAKTAVDAALAAPWIEGAVVPAIEASLVLVAARAAENTQALGHYVGEADDKALRGFLARPGLVPERLLREVVLDDAVEEVMREVLFGVLRQFYDRVNPFSSDAGPVATLRKMMPLGFGVMAKGLDAMRGEVEQRLEPEIRRFLQGMTRTALRNFVETVVAKGDEPSFIALRHHMLRWVLEQRVADVVGDPNTSSAKELRGLAKALAAKVVTSDEAKRELFALVEMAILAHGKQSLREALGVYGIKPVVDVPALAALTWPFVERLVAGDASWAWVEKLVGESWDALEE